jgi:hypothetical protein
VPAHPFSQRPLFIDFKKRLIEEYGCKYEVMECKLDGDFYTITYFERDIGSRALRAVTVFEDDDRVEFSDIRRICRTLEIPPAPFGLDLTDWYELDTDTEN